MFRRIKYPYFHTNAKQSNMPFICELMKLIIPTITVNRKK